MCFFLMVCVFFNCVCVSLYLSCVVLVLLFSSYFNFNVRVCAQGLDKLTAEQQEEVHKVCDIIPDVDVKVSQYSPEFPIRRALGVFSRSRP